MEIIGTQPTPVEGQGEQQQVARDALAEYVMAEFTTGKFDRDSISTGGKWSLNERLLRCLRAARQLYNPEDADLVTPIDSVYLDIIAKKSNALKAWIKDILTMAAEKLFTIEPTPIPELPESLREMVLDRLETELMQMLTTGPDGVPIPLDRAQTASFVQLAKQMKDSALRYAFETARRATQRCERKIQDRLSEGGIRDALDQILDDIATFPYAVIHSPCEMVTRQIVWRGNRAVDEEVPAAQSIRISPFDFYWSNDSTDCQNGRWVGWKARMTAASLYSMLGMEGVDDEAVRATIEKYQNTGYRMEMMQDSEREALEDRASFNHGRTIDVFCYYGKVPGQYLIDRGMSADDPERQYEVVVWVCADTTLKAVFNKYPRGRRPFGKACYRNIPGTFAGEGLPEVLGELQRLCNAAARSLVRNMAYSSGPMGELNVDRLVDGESIDEFDPYRILQTQGDSFGNQSPALRVIRFPSVANEMLAIQKRFDELADDMSGIPAYIMGQTQVAGAGRTLGGLSLLMSNAAKGVKMVIGNLDRGIIEPPVMIEYDMIQLYDPDPSLKADAKVIVRGASGILTREMGQGRAMEALQILVPLAGPQNPADPLIKRGTIEALIKGAFEGLGIETGIQDPRDTLQYELSQAGAQSPAAATSGPALDGRSTSQMRT